MGVRGAVPVVIERRYPQPVTLDWIAAREGQARWCIDANGGEAVLHALTAGGDRSICVFRAPDAEAMRRVGDIIGRTLPTTVWSSSEHWSGLAKPALGTSGRETILGLVDRTFERPTSYAEAQATEDGKADCLRLYDVRFLRSYQSFDQTRMLCLYAAPDLEAIRAANRLSRLPMTDVLQVMVRDAAG